MSGERPAAISANNPSANRSAERRKQVRDRIVLGVAALLLVIGAIAFLQSRTDAGPSPTRASEVPGYTPAPTTEALKAGGKLEPEAHKVAVRFIETAVGRTALDEAWALATPELRSGVTLAQWRTG